MSFGPHRAQRLGDTILSVLDGMSARYDPVYRWLDTKIDTITGGDLVPPAATVDLWGRDTVYTWIQARGLEALAIHAAWLERSPLVPAGERERRVAWCDDVSAAIAGALTASRRRAGGRSWFWMTPDGEHFALGDDGRRQRPRLEPEAANFSDLFVARGLLAVARRHPRYADDARAAYRHALTAIAQGRFASDQQPFDPRNRVGDVPGRRGYGPHMIAIGACALACAAGEGHALAEGLDLAEHICRVHANDAGRWDGIPPEALVEFVDDRGQPWRESGHVVMDPGHAIELVGLVRWLIRCGTPHADPASLPRMAAMDAWLASLLRFAWSVGFNGRGICKSWSLDARAPANDQMPWWSLPESMRAIALTAQADPHPDWMPMLKQAADAFAAWYVNPAAHGWARQTLAADGTAVRVVPATPDADPGYHTGVCLIAALAATREG